jgi:hypothetical protein
MRRYSFATLLAAAALAGGAAWAQDGAGDKAKDPKVAKAERLLTLSGWAERMKAQVSAAVEEQEKKALLPPGTSARFQEIADWSVLLAAAAADCAREMEEEVMDAAIAFYESPAGKKFAGTELRLGKAAAGQTAEWTRKAALAAAATKIEDKAKGAWEKAEEALKARKVSSNETAAIAALRNIAVCQANVQATCKVDCDNDGIGEYGTLLELTGSAGVRKNAAWSVKGPPVSPAIVSPKFGAVDEQGVLLKDGYCYRIYLPDDADPAGFVHETGPKDKPGLAGGTGKIGTDMAECIWCAYAWPEKRGDTGNRTFWINQSGDVFHSSNEIAQWSGAARAPSGNSAYRGAGITAASAVGTRGQDGDVWKVTN